MDRYGCDASSYNSTKTFLAAGGRRTDSADSYTDAELGIGLAMREWKASGAGTRKDIFIVSKVGGRSV
jgi:diketogulonate reductase-like aldo/keto reductase